MDDIAHRVVVTLLLLAPAVTFGPVALCHPSRHRTRLFRVVAAVHAVACLPFMVNAARGASLPGESLSLPMVTGSLALFFGVPYWLFLAVRRRFRLRWQDPLDEGTVSKPRGRFAWHLVAGGLAAIVVALLAFTRGVVEAYRGHEWPSFLWVLAGIDLIVFAFAQVVLGLAGPLRQQAIPGEQPIPAAPEGATPSPNPAES